MKVVSIIGNIVSYSELSRGDASDLIKALGCTSATMAPLIGVRISTIFTNAPKYIPITRFFGKKEGDEIFICNNIYATIDQMNVDHVLFECVFRQKYIDSRRRGDLYILCDKIEPNISHSENNFSKNILAYAKDALTKYNLQEAVKLIKLTIDGMWPISSNDEIDGAWSYKESKDALIADLNNIMKKSFEEEMKGAI